MASRDSESRPPDGGATGEIPHRLPPYSYVTGKYPHPRRDRQGHAFGLDEPLATALDPGDWSNCEMYRYGIELFNHGYYWEAHEAWEAVWHAHQRHGSIADYLKALIKLAAAGVKAREGRSEGVARHAARARQLLLGTQRAFQLETSHRFAGLDLAQLVRLCDQLIADPGQIINTADAPVVVVMPLGLKLP